MQADRIPADRLERMIAEARPHAIKRGDEGTETRSALDVHEIVARLECDVQPQWKLDLIDQILKKPDDARFVIMMPMRIR